MKAARICAMLAQMTCEEKAELMDFAKFLIHCQDEGRTVTEQEVQEMAAAARERIAKHQCKEGGVHDAE